VPGYRSLLIPVNGFLLGADPVFKQR